MTAKIDQLETQEDVQLALADVEFIRSMIEDRENSIPDQTELAMTALVAGASLTLLVFERVFFPHITDNLLASAQNPELRQMILINSGITLAVLAAGVYGLAWRRARELCSTAERTLGRRFEFLKFDSFVPDLLLKAFSLSAMVIANQPQYVSALLMAFIADYAWQGRFFRASRHARIATGLVLYITALGMMITQTAWVAVPLAAFSGLSLSSLAFIVIARKRRHE
ncbi:MAG: hypothetical protein NDI61_08010 [Bdellovibrionaceae bacterium]|nr:hypothetical protein [Pseudobdellovibrionaceae bacterium]